MIGSLHRRRAAMRGWTLAEMMVALSVGAIIVVGADAVIFIGQRASDGGLAKLSSQRDLSFAMERLGQYARCASDFVVQNGGTQLLIEQRSNGTLTSARTVALVNGALTITDTAGNTETVIAGGVGALTFSYPTVSGVVQKDTVAVHLEIGSGDGLIAGDTAFASRLSLG